MILFNQSKKKGAYEIVMNENINERGSTSSENVEGEIIADDQELDDPRLRFIFNYLSIAFGTTPVGFKKGVQIILRAFFSCFSFV